MFSLGSGSCGQVACSTEMVVPSSENTPRMLQSKYETLWTLGTMLQEKWPLWWAEQHMLQITNLQARSAYTVCDCQPVLCSFCACHGINIKEKSLSFELGPKNYASWFIGIMSVSLDSLPLSSFICFLAVFALYLRISSAVRSGVLESVFTFDSP